MMLQARKAKPRAAAVAKTEVPLDTIPSRAVVTVAAFVILPFPPAIRVDLPRPPLDSEAQDAPCDDQNGDCQQAPEEALDDAYEFRHFHG